MKTFNIIQAAVVSFAFSFLLVGCVNDLNTTPLDPRVTTADKAYSTPESYKQGLAKIYGALALTGQTGAGSGEIKGVDDGASQFLRGLWNLQELPTDEAKCSWGDAEIRELNIMGWSSIENKIIKAFYYRITFSISLVNEYLRQTSPEALADRGVSDEMKATIEGYRHEARFIRALMYTYGIDAFGNMPFFTEKDPVGVFFPPMGLRKDIFTYIESELLEIAPLMAEPHAQEFGRVDRTAAWTLLTRLYLNGEVYAGVNRYDDCVAYCNRVIGAGYALAPKYENLFKSNNDFTNTEVYREMIYTVNFDGTNTQSYGGTTFLVDGSRQAGKYDSEQDMEANLKGFNDVRESGTTDGWGGNRTIASLVDKFPNEDLKNEAGYLDTPDGRAIIYMQGRTKAMTTITDAFFEGYGVYKFRSLSSEGTLPANLVFSSTDYPVMRLAEVYLTYAEAVARGGSGAERAPIDVLNELRVRAYGSDQGNITSYDLQYILDERARELYWEGHRRTDLVRYGLFTSADYLWPWKGGANVGRSVDAKYNVYPIPASDINANPNLSQNPGY